MFIDIVYLPTEKELWLQVLQGAYRTYGDQIIDAENAALASAGLIAGLQIVPEDRARNLNHKVSAYGV